MTKVSLYRGEITFAVSDEDKKWLCDNVFLTDDVTEDLWRMEFVTGTGITPNNPKPFNLATKMFAEYVDELRHIKDVDVNAMCRELIDKTEKKGVIL